MRRPRASSVAVAEALDLAFGVAVVDFLANALMLLCFLFGACGGGLMEQRGCAKGRLRCRGC